MSDKQVAPTPVFSSFFNNIPIGADEEEFKILAESNGLVIERIVSHGHTSSEWYDQEETEFCSVLKGAADLLFKDSVAVRMNIGDWVIIPPHAKHKVTWTIESEPTIWVAVKWKK